VTLCGKEMNSSPLSSRLRETIRLDPVNWAAACRIQLRPYQRQIARAVKDSILDHLGLSFVVILPRQSGKNEVQAHIFSWLLFRYSKVGGRIVSVSPTFKPQTENNMRRVAKSLDACVGSRGLWRSSKGYIYTLGEACLQFFSGDPAAKVVGATADLLLSVDEAQEVSISKYDKDFSPMVASTNATRIFWGTAWTANTLLERERRAAQQAQEMDGIRRVFFFTAEDVFKILPDYRAFVESLITRHGRNNPLVRSQFYCETIDAQSGMFNPTRLSLITAIQTTPSATIPLHGDFREASPPALEGQPPVSLNLGSKPEWIEEQDSTPATPRAGSSHDPNQFYISGGQTYHHEDDWGGSGYSDNWFTKEEKRNQRIAQMEYDAWLKEHKDDVYHTYVFLIDVAGMDESKTDSVLSFDSGFGNPGRDSTTLTVVEIDHSTIETLTKPTYHVVARHSWTGENHVAVFGKIKALYESLSPLYIVIDATGVGEGLWAMLDHQFHTRTVPVKFTQQEKSEVGWRFLEIIETGRFRDHVHTEKVHTQYANCIMNVLPGPGKVLRWGVPDGTRGSDGELIHDDFILADALTAKLDQMDWYC
jgi:hypothetical protein